VAEGAGLSPAQARQLIKNSELIAKEKLK